MTQPAAFTLISWWKMDKLQRFILSEVYNEHLPQAQVGSESMAQNTDLLCNHKQENKDYHRAALCLVEFADEKKNKCLQ